MTAKKTVKIEGPRRKRVTFRFKTEADSDVRLVGSFNNWDPENRAMSRKNGDGVYSATLLLTPGRHEYKFVVNGEWQCDPACPHWVQNELGTLNSVVEVE
jgi:1,4-alpha-glucan branching enzyme